VIRRAQDGLPAGGRAARDGRGLPQGRRDRCAASRAVGPLAGKSGQRCVHRPQLAGGAGGPLCGTSVAWFPTECMSMRSDRRVGVRVVAPIDTERRKRYFVVVPSKAAISTPFPSAYDVAKKLGVRKRRATHLIHLMDNIHASDAVSVSVGGNTRHSRTAVKSKLARRSVRARSRRR
jgi:hypothetical protein